MTVIPHIDKETFLVILQDNKILRTDDLLIFQTIYSLDKQEASATDLARIIGWTDKNAVIGRIVGLGKRILKKYNIKQRERRDGSKSFWDFFFTGYYKERFFIYQLKPELKEALEECGLTTNIKPISSHNTHLFVWNPKRWVWVDLEQNIEELRNTGKVALEWSCRSHKNIKPSDRVFLAKLGTVPRGIMASGKVASEPFLSPHWNGENKDIPKVLIEFDVLLNPIHEPILMLDQLTTGNLARQHWMPESPRIAIRPEVVDELEEKWFKFLGNQNVRYNPFLDIVDSTKIFVEGSTTQVTQTRYERNIYARKECLKYYGYSCIVCGFNFEKHYGNIGYQFIHVHHLIQIASIKQEYRIDPIKDLRPVCPNCHAMLHRSNPPLPIEELQEQISNAICEERAYKSPSKNLKK